MSLLRVIVCVKVVPRPEEVKVNPATHTLDRVNARNMVNPPDMNALEIALDLKDKHGAWVGVVTMGPKFFEDYMRMTLMMGADAAYILSDRGFAGADTLATTYVLAKGIEKANGADVVLCGEESSDGATGQVPQGIAEWLNYAQVTNVVSLAWLPDQGRIETKRELEGGWEVLRARLPAVCAVRAGVNEPRFLDFRRATLARAAEAPVAVWSASDLGCDPALIGVPGSPTVAVQLKELPRRERKRERIAGSPDEAARALALKLKAWLMPPERAAK